MKKLLLVLLALLFCCLMVSCDSGSSPDIPSTSESSPDIPLTMENVEDYIEIDGTVKVNTDTRCTYKDEWVNLVNSLKCSLTAKGNPNYEYKDVILEIRIYHLHPLTKEVISENKVFLDLNLAGNGESSGVLGTLVDIEGWENVSNEAYAFYSSSGIDTALKTTGYEIVSVSGSVVKN